MSDELQFVARATLQNLVVWRGFPLWTLVPNTSCPNEGTGDNDDKLKFVELRTSVSRVRGPVTAFVAVFRMENGKQNLVINRLHKPINISLSS